MITISSALDFWVVLLALAAAVFLPFVLGLVALLKFRQRECPPLSLTLLLGAAAVASGVFVAWIPGFSLFLSLPALAGLILCLTLSIAFALRRCCRRLSFPGAASAAGAGVLVPLICFDFRFRIEVEDADGKAVEIAGDAIDLRRPPKGLFQSYEYGKGVRLKRGTIYFGFIQWLRHKENWTFSGSFGDADGRYRGDLEWKPAGWSEWPKIVVVQPPLPSW